MPLDHNLLPLRDYHKAKRLLWNPQELSVGKNISSRTSRGRVGKGEMIREQADSWDEQFMSANVQSAKQGRIKPWVRNIGG